QLVPGLLAGRPWPDKATEHLPDFNRACARCHDRIVGGEGPQLLFIVSLHGAKTQEPLASSTGPKITIWPDSTQGRQCSAWRAMISRSSSLMSSANVGRVAGSRKTNVLMSQECQVPDHGRVPRQFVAGGSTGLGRARGGRGGRAAGGGGPPGPADGRRPQGFTRPLGRPEGACCAPPACPVVSSRQKVVSTGRRLPVTLPGRTGRAGPVRLHDRVLEIRSGGSPTR